MTSLPRLSDGADQAIGSYLAEVAAGLPGPTCPRRDILAELGAGIADTPDTYHRVGQIPAQVARSATEFGSPDQVAAGFRAELAAAQARCSAVTLLLIGSLTGSVWVAAVRVGHIGATSLASRGRLATHLAVIFLATAVIMQDPN